MVGTPLIHYRTFRNDDPPRLSTLWNRSLPDKGVVRPLSAHEFDAIAINRVDFDRDGLIVADRDGVVVGFTHAGLGPDEPDGPSHRLDPLLGTVAMLVVDPDVDLFEVGLALVDRAERYLQRRGARVLYAGGRYPLDPFYPAIYGGSEWSGILADDGRFRRVVEKAGYGEAAWSTLLERDLVCAEVRDPKVAIFRRQTRFEAIEDVKPAGWWDALAIGPGAIDGYRLVGRADGLEVGRASTWDMAAFGRGDGKARVGLRGVEVAPEHRRKGFGRHLIREVIRHLQGQWGDVVSVTADQANIPVLRLYESVGFTPVGSSVLYRKPGP